MPEYISREMLRDLMYTEAFERDTGLQRWDSGLWIRYKLFENCIEAIPAADVVEVVRCRECKHHDGIRCFRWNSVIATGFDDYCSNGERKGGGQDE